MLRHSLVTRSCIIPLMGALLCVLAPSVSLAAGPANVTVRVEGATETKLPPTLVTTTNTPVVNDGNSEHRCDGTSALGALQLATGGNWKGPWSEKEEQYFIEEIEGEGETVGSSNSKYYWSFWLNDTYEETGACDVQLETGDRVLFLPICYENCPSGAEPTPLEIEAPGSTNVGEQVAVTIRQYNAKGEASPAAGANVEGASAVANTDSQGHATLTFSSAGSYTLKVTGASNGPSAVRTETTVCVHSGNDGTCGTTALGKSNSQQSSPSVVPPPVVARITAQIEGLHEGHVYSRRHAPRTLSGKIESGVAVTSISIRLRRSYKGRCWAYNGALELLRHTRCGQGGFFKIKSQGSSFSYLLPSKLPPGRYVFEVEATNANGQHTESKSGSSKITFRVG